MKKVFILAVLVTLALWLGGGCHWDEVYYYDFYDPYYYSYQPACYWDSWWGEYVCY